MTAVTREHKDQALERIKSDPFVKRLGFERFERWAILTLEGTDAGRADLPPVDDAPSLATLRGHRPRRSQAGQGPEGGRGPQITGMGNP